jgi:FtsP/CotA-like multicopper oxidase with cupredoxin domain
LYDLILFAMTPPKLLALLASGLLAISGAVAEPLPDRVGPLAARQTIIPGGRPCGQNNATNRGCWKNNWNISTDYEINTPPAFNTREYVFTITNVTNWLGPDGIRKPAMLINNQFPGPTITADWGDYIVVTVVNALQDNGTSIHWHGIRQFGESNQDGANGVTECPIPPGKNATYSFHVTQYGTSWYHSHFSTQYGNGVVGSLVVNGPTSDNWDIDLGPYPIMDYYWETADRLQRRAELPTGGPPDSDNVLFRGKNINPNGTGGAYDFMTLTKGKKHLLRLINPSVDNSFTVSLVGHNFLVVAADLVPIKPVVRSKLFMGVGQRYDVIINANQTETSYWFNATLESTNQCGRSKNKFPAAVFRYNGQSTALPTNKGTPVVANCLGEKGLVPWVPRVVDKSLFAPTTLPLDVSTPVVPVLGTVFRWLVKGVDISIDWGKPVLQYVMEGNTSYPVGANIIDVPARDTWTFWIIQNNFFIPHPVHLHGHDFLVIGTGVGVFNPSNATMMNALNFNNPTRRDVEEMPGSGYLILAFRTDNPGTWLMHCHIAWHVSQGLGVTFVERKQDVPGLRMNMEQFTNNCAAWNKYAKTAKWPKLDSGL